jgi:hypothetical protein
MAIEYACMRVVRKPWGSTDLRPWSDVRQDGVAIGELWFQRPDKNAPERLRLEHDFAGGYTAVKDLDFGLNSMAPRPEGRRHFRPRRHDPCHRSGTRGCRDPAEKRRDVPPIRLWSAAGTSRRQRRGGRECGAG